MPKLFVLCPELSDAKLYPARFKYQTKMQNILSSTILLVISVKFIFDLYYRLMSLLTLLPHALTLNISGSNIKAMDRELFASISLLLKHLELPPPLSDS